MTDPRRVTAAHRGLFGVLLAVVLSPQAFCSETLGAGSGLSSDYIPALPWQEQAVSLPAYPRDAELIPVALPPRDTLKLYLDPNGLSRGADAVVRYVLVVEAPGGARNVLYEGMRCETREFKTYAIGSSERSWRLLEKPSWQKIPYYEVDAFRHHLYHYTFCDAHASARAPREILRVLRYAEPQE